MKTLFHLLQRHYSSLYKGFMVLVSIFLIVQLFPRQPGFDYDYQQARPWLYDDLIAPFSFAILKTDGELTREKERVMEEFMPYFSRDSEVAASALAQFARTFDLAWEEKYPGGGHDRFRSNSREEGLQLLARLFERGVVALEDSLRDALPSQRIRVLEQNIARTMPLGNLYTVQEAFREMILFLEGNADQVDGTFLRPLLEDVIDYNIRYNDEFTTRALEMEMESISTTRGMVQEGEKIISKGELVTSNTYQILESFRAAFTAQIGDAYMEVWLYTGQFLLVGISMAVLLLILFYFRREVFADNRRVLLILLSVLLMLFLTSLVVRNWLNLLFLVPVTLVPIIIRAFFDNRLAFYIHVISIILIGFLIPRSFEFVFLQFVAGIVAILSMSSLRRRSQLFVTASLIFATYSAVYFGLSLAHTGSFEGISYVHFLFFAGSALLTLFAYPLIFLFERLFGLPTDFSLLELADTNNILLRRLGLNAPGTFQHSLQVANLSEEAVLAIGGHGLLVRAGALYHDIGKMDNPLYYIENQSQGYNPHDEISHHESAKIIIGHVIKGIEMARKHGLPEYLIDFIRTHHGTTTARYFYTMEVNQSVGKSVNKADFVYPGPKPFSKETAVLMMADSVEAASRSLGKPDEKQIDNLVEGIIDTQMGEKQFDNADITFRDITRIKSIFKRMLMNIYHVRVAYPSLGDS